MDKLLLLHKLIKYLLFSYLMQIKMIIMLLVFFEIANQIDKSDEMPHNGVHRGRRVPRAARRRVTPSHGDGARRRRAPRGHQVCIG